MLCSNALYGQRQKCSYMSQFRTWFSYTELRKTAGEQTFLISGISNHFSEICNRSIEIHCGVELLESCNQGWNREVFIQNNGLHVTVIKFHLLSEDLTTKIRTTLLAWCMYFTYPMLYFIITYIGCFQESHFYFLLQSKCYSLPFSHPKIELCYSALLWTQNIAQLLY